MTTSLLDSNVVIALAVQDHEQHDLAVQWFATTTSSIATCPITEGALVRHVVRGGRPMTTALTFLDALAQHDSHQFWPDDLTFQDVPVRGVIGHRQVTDAYLAELARRRGGRVVTFDKGFAALHADVADLIPTEEKP